MSIHLIEPFNLSIDDKAAIDLEWMVQEDSLRLHKLLPTLPESHSDNYQPHLIN